jgi:hypothetical protein
LGTVQFIKDIFFYVILYFLFYFVELLQFLLVVRVKLLGSPSFEGLGYNFLGFCPVLLAGVKLLNRRDTDTAVVLVLAEYVLLLNDLFVVDEIVAGVVVVEVCVSLLALLADSARFLDVPLLYYFFIEVVGYVVELALLFLLDLNRTVNIQAF